VNRVCLYLGFISRVVFSFILFCRYIRKTIYLFMKIFTKEMLEKKN